MPSKSTLKTLSPSCLSSFAVLLATLSLLASALFAVPFAKSASAQTPFETRVTQTDAQIAQLASSGQNSTQILKTIYPNASIATIATMPSPRVLLAESSSTVFRPTGINRVTIDNETLFRATPGTDIRVSLQNERWHVHNPNALCPVEGCAGDVLRVLFGTATSVHVGATGRSYFHGRFSLFKTGNGNFRIVLDYLRFEDYLKGLNVATFTWNAEALKARAIEARTHMLALFNAREDSFTWSEHYDFHSSLPDLSYYGDDVELNTNAAGWVSAVTATAGQIMSTGPATQSPAPTSPAPSAPTTPAPTVTTPPASTGTHITFSGRGWGHGVGMSQYGARGRANAGHTYDQILNFYYPGTQLATQGSPISDLRIYLRTATLTSFTPSGSGSIQLDNQALTTVSPNTQISVRMGGGNWHISAGGVSHCPAAGCVGSAVYLNFATGSSMNVQGARSYSHGRIALTKASSASYRIVLDSVHMEDYLRGIAEMPTDWSVEAQKVQAVAARSYAYAVAIDRRNNAGWTLPFDVYASTNDQYYIGDAREKNQYSTSWFQAITSTSNQVLLYNGQHAVTHYSSSNGGYVSEDTFRSLINRKPYLRSAPDPYDSYTNPYATWQVTFSHADISTWLNAYSDTSVGTFHSVSIGNRRDSSGRVNASTVTIRGTSGATKTVSGSRFYAVVNAGSLRQSNNYARTLRSTLFNVGSTPPVVPTGSGSGSGGVTPSTTPPSLSGTPPTTTTIPLTPQDAIDLSGSFDSLIYEGNTLYASGSVVMVPKEELSISFLVDEERVIEGSLNQSLAVTTPAGRVVTDNFAFKNDLNLPRAGGGHSVCMFASGGGEEILVGCRKIGLSTELPAAGFETLETEGAGHITASGWAYDIDDISADLRIRVLITKIPKGSGSTYLPTLFANQENEDFAESVNKLAGMKAWEVDIRDVSAGTHELCAWASDSHPSESRSTFMGCKRVTVR